MSGLEKELVVVSGLFDPNWYRTFYPDVADSGLDAVTHYLRIGGQQNRHPSRLFDAGFYVSKYPDVAEAGLNPLVHYLKFGLSEGRQSRSLARNRDCQLILGSGFFVQDWYLKTNIDVARAGEDPLDHFLEAGGIEGRSPSLYFNAELYLLENPDVAKSGSNPLFHYLQYGVAEERQPMAVDVS